MGLSAVGEKEWLWVSASRWQHWGRAGTVAWGSFPCWLLKGSGIYSPCGEKAEPCSWAASLGDAKSQPRLFTTVFLSWFLALVSSVTTLWSASQEPRLSFQLAGTVLHPSVCLPGLLQLPGSPLFGLHKVVPSTFRACPCAQPVLSDGSSRSRGV